MRWFVLTGFLVVIFLGIIGVFDEPLNFVANVVVDVVEAVRDS
jgi:hypothetical protein